MTLETGRLILKPWQPAEWVELRPIATDPEVMRHINGGVPWSDEAIQEFVSRQATLFAARGLCRWRLIEKQSGTMIGFCGVGTWRENPELEIGWWLARPFWGRGLATEAARIALRDAFERVRLDRVISIARPANVASTRIMQKLGLKFHRGFEADGVRLVEYALDRAEYARVNCNSLYSY